MTKRSLAVLALVYVPHAISQPKPSPITIGETVQLQSNMLKESRSLLIAKPAGYDDGTERIPCYTYSTANCTSTTRAEFRRFWPGVTECPRCSSWGSFNGDAARRTRDLTPPSTSESDNRFSPGNGERLPVLCS